jgi:hypothetical protein
MKKTLSSNPSGKQIIQTSVLFCAAVLLASAFWFLTSSSAFAGACQVCHKGSQTQTYDCSELEYFRHLDHGDPMGPCPATRVARKGKGERR